MTPNFIAPHSYHAHRGHGIDAGARPKLARGSSRSLHRSRPASCQAGRVVLAARVAEHHAKDDHAHQLAAEFDRVRRPIELRLLTGRRFEALGHLRPVARSLEFEQAEAALGDETPPW